MNAIVVCILGTLAAKCTRLNDRDYDVTPPHIILILSLTCAPNAPGVGEGVRGVLWILSAKSARCTVKMVGEEWPVGLGLGKRRL